LRALSKKLGIPVLAKEDGEHKLLGGYEAGDKKLWKKRGGDLRLIAKAEVKSYPNQGKWNFEDLDTDVAYVVVVGETLKKLKALRKETKQAAKQSRGFWEVRPEHNDALIWESTLDFAALFGSLGLGALTALIDAVGMYRSDAPKGSKPKPDAPEEDQVAFLRRRAAKIVVKGWKGVDFYRASPLEALITLSQLAENCGIELSPRIRGLAGQMDADLRERFPAEYKRDHEKQDVVDDPGDGDSDHELEAAQVDRGEK
jgi:hypothetical protein